MAAPWAACGEPKASQMLQLPASKANILTLVMQVRLIERLANGIVLSSLL